MKPNPLVRAIIRGLAPGGNLTTELERLGDYPVRRRREARAICKGLARLALAPGQDKRFASRLRALLRLFHLAQGRLAYEVLYIEGRRLLIEILDSRIEQALGSEAESLLSLLEVLACPMYASPKGTRRIIEAVRQPFEPDSPQWFDILERFAEQHPHSKHLFASLSHPLPEGNIALALLHSSNRAAELGNLKSHPFDSPEGHEWLREAIAVENPANSYVPCLAAAALPYISDPPRQELLAAALDHCEAAVQIEAARAAAKLGLLEGLKRLAQACADVRLSRRAQTYLETLGRQDLIPLSARDPSFRARAELADWLASPDGLGRAADELEVIDHRVLAWPPEREPKPLWLIRFCVRSELGFDELIGVGMAGSITYCFTDHQMERRPREDVYAYHCYAEMFARGLITELEPRDASEYDDLLRHWRGAALEQPAIMVVAELSPELQYPSTLVAVAACRLGDEEGWVVLDGPRSAWYPKVEQPEETDDRVVLGIHVGRQLLGFHDKPDRKAWLRAHSPRGTPRQALALYESLMSEVPDAEPIRQQELLGDRGLLWRYLPWYASAAADVRGQAEPDVLADTFGRCLELAAHAHEAVREEAYDYLGENDYLFKRYVDIQVDAGTPERVAPLIELFAERWQHPQGYAQLGRAAMLIGQLDKAEAYLSKLRDEYEWYFALEHMGYLAELWHRQGRQHEARALLVDCMQKLRQAEAESETHSDREFVAHAYSSHRATYLQLFPDGQTELARLGLPAEL